MSDPGKPGEGLDERQKQQLTKLGVIVGIGILLVLFIFRNTRDVKVSFVFFTTTSSLIWVIISSMVLGLLMGWLLPGQLRRYRAARKVKKNGS